MEDEMTVNARLRRLLNEVRSIRAQAFQEWQQANDDWFTRPEREDEADHALAQTEALDEFLTTLVGEGPNE